MTPILADRRKGRFEPACARIGADRGAAAGRRVARSTAGL